MEGPVTKTKRKADVVPTAHPDDMPILTKCAYCGAALSSRDDEWASSVNVTPDCIFLGSSMVEFNEAIPDASGETVEDSYDWCDIDCFGRWIYHVANQTSAVAR